MRFLAVDPSTTCTGWAVFDGDRLIASGSTRGKSRTSIPERVELMLEDIVEAVAHALPKIGVEAVVVETPSMKAATHEHKKRQASGVLYSFWCGYIARSLEDQYRRLIMVPADKWTSSARKESRQIALKLRGFEFANKDEGDAIDLGLWHIEQQHQRSLESRIIRGEKRPGGEAVVEIREVGT